MIRIGYIDGPIGKMNLICIFFLFYPLTSKFLIDLLTSILSF